MNLNRPVRAGAGKQKKYDEREYALLSFPEKKKHAMVPLSVIDMDPLDNNDCSIKVAGRRRGARVIARGSKVDINLKSTRFAKDAGSEEVDLDGAYVSKETDNDSHSNCSYPPEKNNSLKSPTTVVRNRENDRMGSSKSPESTIARTTQAQREVSADVKIDRLNNELMLIYDGGHKRSISPLSSIDSDDSLEDCIGVKKTNKGGMRSNVDLTRATKKYKRRRKKGKTDENATSGTSEPAFDELCQRMADYEEQSAEMKTELNLIKNKLTLMRRNNHYSRIWSPTAAMSVSATNECKETLFAQIQTIFGVNVSEIKAPKGRPSMVMREVFKKSGHIQDWRSMFKANEELLQDFISNACNIQPDDLDMCWDGIKKSLKGMPSDLKTNKRKSRNGCAVVDNTPTPVTQLSSVDALGSLNSVPRDNVDIGEVVAPSNSDKRFDESVFDHT